MNAVEPIRDPNVIEAIIRDLKQDDEMYHAMFLVGIYTGLRISDQLRLRVRDMKQTELRIRQKKNKSWVTLEINPDLRRGIADYLEGKDDDDYLFISRQVKLKVRIKSPPHRTTVYKRWSKVGRKYGLRSFGCHTTRKTFGYFMYEENERNIGLLMEIFGHSDPSITLRYIGVTQDTINKAVRKLKFRAST